jgi:hypothetical protein
MAVSTSPSAVVLPVTWAVSKPRPDQRAGRWVNSDQPLLIGSLSDDSEFGPRGSRRLLQRSDHPQLQNNLPFVDAPSLGQIARDRRQYPKPTPAAMHLDLPEKILSWLHIGNSLWRREIDIECLLQDPDWYENLPDCESRTPLT